MGAASLSFIAAVKQPPEAMKPVGSRAKGVPKRVRQTCAQSAFGDTASGSSPSSLREWKRRATRLAVCDAPRGFCWLKGSFVCCGVRFACEKERRWLKAPARCGVTNFPIAGGES